MALLSTQKIYKGTTQLTHKREPKKTHKEQTLAHNQEPKKKKKTHKNPITHNTQNSQQNQNPNTDEVP